MLDNQSNKIKLNQEHKGWASALMVLWCYLFCKTVCGKYNITAASALSGHNVFLLFAMFKLFFEVYLI